MLRFFLSRVAVFRKSERQCSVFNAFWGQKDLSSREVNGNAPFLGAFWALLNGYAPFFMPFSCRFHTPKWMDLTVSSGWVCSVFATQPMNIIDALKSFAAMSDSERVRLLISFGFRGENFGRTMLGMRRFFGGRDNNNDRWNVIFSGFSKEETRKAVNAYLTQYNGNAKNMVAEIQLPTQHNFAYYTLTYPEFLSASLDNAPKYYFTVQGRLDDCDIEALGSYSSNPLLSYHTEPFACCVAALFSNRNKSIYEDLEWSSRYAYKAALYMKRKGIGIRMGKGFWNILCEDDVTLDQTVQNKFRVQNDTELHEAPNQDLITTAVDFVESIYTLQPDK